MLINVKKPPIVDILTFMNRRIDFMLGRVEVEKGFITSGPGKSTDQPMPSIPGSAILYTI